jgi:predicted nuclease of predicted toxin-antitoxin system
MEDAPLLLIAGLFNLSPLWCGILSAEGWNTIHWSKTGDPRATDKEIMEWARTQGWVVFTHDLDFGVILALTHSTGPSVVQIRTQNVLPAHLKPTIITVFRRCESLLVTGALVTIDEIRSRVRILPL